MNLAAARERARHFAEALYDGTVTIYTYERGRADDGEDTNIRIDYASELPCRISYDTSAAANGGASADAVAQSATLFISPDIIVAPGAYIEVTQDGRTAAYRNTGIPRFYASHQEVAVVAAERWA